MSLIHVNKFWQTCLCFAALCCAGAGRVAAQDGTVTAEITSNAIYALSGQHDTLWVITANGLNFTIIPATLQPENFLWWGYKSETPVQTVAYSRGQALGAFYTATISNSNKLLSFTHFNNALQILDVGWNRTNLNRYGEETKTSSALIVSSIVAHDSIFFCAATHGGVIAWNKTANRSVIYYPGLNKLPCAINAFPPPSIATFPDSNKAVLALAIDQDSARTRVCTMLPRDLWFLSLNDTTWDSSRIALADSSARIIECLRIFSVPDTQSTHLFASIVSGPTSTAADTSLYRYERPTNTWKPFLAHKNVISISGFGSRFYLIHSNDILLFTDTLSAIPTLTASHFRSRLLAAGGTPDNIQLNDILYMPHQNDTEATLCIATSFGLYVSRTELADERTSQPFVHVYRSRALSAELKETYAVPGIINLFSNGTTYFAYNLKNSAAVTISIFDWSMNKIKTVVKNSPRQAGSSRAEGRSTDLNQDVWDCTDQSGRLVPIGVYYYEIKSDKGERAFGKIVVAQ